MKKKILVLLPSYGSFAWFIWYAVQGKGAEVIIPNLKWLLLVTGMATGIIWWITRRNYKKKGKALAVKDNNIIQEERLIAKEVCTWKTVIRERSIYAKSK